MIEARCALEVTITDRSLGDDRLVLLALNEVVIEKIEFGHTVRLATTIDDEEALTYSADGLIVATPTGSTAYNLSAGGPILAPTLRAMVVTPVAPHFSLDRSLVLTDEQVVMVEVAPDRAAALVVDGQEVGRLQPGSTVTCRVRRTAGPGRAQRAPDLRRHPALSPAGRPEPVTAGPVLTDLHVRDLGVIEDLSLEFGPGMTVLTGETGAGKTLVVEALQLVLGGRADPAMVRAGRPGSVGRGTLRRGEGDTEREVILARSVPAEGRSRAWVDGRMATAGRPRRGRGGAGRDPRAARAPRPRHRRRRSATCSTPSPVPI